MFLSNNNWNNLPYSMQSNAVVALRKTQLTELWLWTWKDTASFRIIVHMSIERFGWKPKGKFPILIYPYSNVRPYDWRVCQKLNLVVARIFLIFITTFGDWTVELSENSLGMKSYTSVSETEQAVRTVKSGPELMKWLLYRPALSSYLHSKL